MTKMQLVKLNAIANKIENMEVKESKKKIMEIVYIITQERKNQKLSQDELAAKAHLASV